MKIAFIADIHGNTHGLDAVLTDIEIRHDVDSFWFAGDYCTAGPDPIGVLERITTLPDAVFIRGNSDARLVTGGAPGPGLEELKARPELIPLALDLRSILYWATGAVVATDWLDWIRTLPLEQRLTLPDGTKLLMVHASPGHDNGDGLYPSQSDEKLAELARGCQDDIILVGHTHIPYERHAGKYHWVNPGSIAQPMSGDPRASYAILDADESGYQFSFYRVDYDRDAFLDFARRRYYPGVDDLIAYFDGKHTPDTPWY